MAAHYVEFEPPLVVNFGAKGVMRFLQVSIQVMTRDHETSEMIKLHDPKIRNNMLLLGSQTYEPQGGNRHDSHRIGGAGAASGDSQRESVAWP